MDGEAYLQTPNRIELGVRPRSFLFLQGPIATFFDRLGRALLARGHRVHRINLHFGDRLFWRLPAADYRGRFADWRSFVAAELERHQVTDMVLHGDRRPYHIVAAEEARARGIRVIDTDLGYLRPDWITLEYDGMTTYSRFPRDPAAIRALAEEFPEPDLAPRFHTPFWLIAALDVAYNLGLVFGRLLYPHYRYHSTCHPFVEYAGWLWSRAARLLRRRGTVAARFRRPGPPGSYFLVPLQLSTDFQIRAHSPFADVREAVREIVASFAASGCERRLVFVIHPLDNGLIGWDRLITRLARQHGVPGRVMALPGGTPIELLCGAAGIITINSTVGVTAVHHGIPLKVLGNAVFDIAGLTCQAPLETFWHDPPRPDPELTRAFLCALAGATQVKGGYYVRAAQDCAIAGFVERLEAGLFPLPALSAAELAARQPRAKVRTIILSGVCDPIGLALARHLAMPGIRLCLLGSSVGLLDQAAADCRRRGALVETFSLGLPDNESLGELRSAVEQDPPDTIIAYAGGCGSIDRHFVERDIGSTMQLIGSLGDTMRRHGQGQVMLVSGLAATEISGDQPTIRAAVKAYRTYAAPLSRRYRRDGISVSVAVPSQLALFVATRWRKPLLAALAPDRVAELVLHALRRRQVQLILPGTMTMMLRLLLLLPSVLGEAARPDLVSEDAEAAPLAGRSASGD